MRSLILNFHTFFDLFDAGQLVGKVAKIVCKKVKISDWSVYCMTTELSDFKGRPKKRLTGK